MSAADLARETHMSPQYIQALEEGAYDVFPAKVYAQGVLRRVIQVYGSQDRPELSAMLEHEWPQRAKLQKHPTLAAGEGWGARVFTMTPRRLGLIAAGGLLLGLAVFWSVRVAVFAAPPALSIEVPQDRSRWRGSAVAVKGSAERESRLTVNGREITLDERGRFDEKVELPLGANRLEFVSESRFGKISQGVRYVLVE